MPLFYVDVIESLGQDCGNSIANAQELLQSWAKPSWYPYPNTAAGLANPCSKVGHGVLAL